MFFAPTVCLSLEIFIALHKFNTNKVVEFENFIMLHILHGICRVGGFNGDSYTSVKGSLGETAVGFDFAPPAIGTWSGEDQTTSNPTNWPIFILWGDGRIFFVITSLGGQNSQASKPRVMGPLPMLPESDDNYGSDACGLLCLHPVISSPPILVRY